MVFSIKLAGFGHAAISILVHDIFRDRVSYIYSNVNAAGAGLLLTVKGMKLYEGGYNNCIIETGSSKVDFEVGENHGECYARRPHEQLNTMILGGNDTTVVTFTWALSLLLNNPHVLKRAQDELDMHVGSDRQVDESDIIKLEYLQAIVKETLRLYPAAPLAAPHEAIEECTIAGFHVPVGTRILPNLYKIHRDPRVWLDPSKFKPERFLTSHVDVDLRGQHFELIPFGSGRRMCPGLSFALQVLHLGLARLLHEFEFANPSNSPVDMTESPGLTNIKATPLEVLLSPRLPPKLYG
ncbi:xanthotoxin 5-hydroxylase CYP82C4-like [Macadamia integrifolia]|uniref:xanthotoxin 5-hydroxylase CYP82C4-like n=1 Tax=Macadamia integrifolia TaxID=60698 RepID=UPI001C4F4422|nr:xanthotoxin 5-hydroxylase CYP82C4-like [Macadamia integrifolia]